MDAKLTEKEFEELKKHLRESNLSGKEKALDILSANINKSLFVNLGSLSVDAKFVLKEEKYRLVEKAVGSDKAYCARCSDNAMFCFGQVFTKVLVVEE